MLKFCCFRGPATFASEESAAYNELYKNTPQPEEVKQKYTEEIKTILASHVHRETKNRWVSSTAHQGCINIFEFSIHWHSWFCLNPDGYMPIVIAIKSELSQNMIQMSYVYDFYLTGHAMYMILILQDMLCIRFSSYRTCYVYDEFMKKHKSVLDPGHPERPERISRIYEMLGEYGLLAKCVKLPSRKATHKELSSVHRSVIQDFGTWLHNYALTPKCSTPWNTRRLWFTRIGRNPTLTPYHLSWN